MTSCAASSAMPPPPVLHFDGEELPDYLYALLHETLDTLQQNLEPRLRRSQVMAMLQFASKYIDEPTQLIIVGLVQGAWKWGTRAIDTGSTWICINPLPASYVQGIGKNRSFASKNIPTRTAHYERYGQVCWKRWFINLMSEFGISLNFSLEGSIHWLLVLKNSLLDF